MAKNRIMAAKRAKAIKCDIVASKERRYNQMAASDWRYYYDAGCVLQEMNDILKGVRS